jgi:hypothetical protein
VLGDFTLFWQQESDPTAKRQFLCLSSTAYGSTAGAS